MATALLIIDVQNDFCPGGALPVPNGHEVVPIINTLASQYETVILTQDWHPAGHSSFASSHKGLAPYDTVELDYGQQVLWPDHCIKDSQGAAFHPDLRTDGDLILRKGFRSAIDSYSAFFENDQKTVTGLHGYLQSRQISSLTLVGLATDFCVSYSAQDAARLGYAVTVDLRACRGINLDGSLNAALLTMASAGVTLQDR